MQLIRYLIPIIILLLTLNNNLWGQRLADEEYAVINDIYGCTGDKGKFRLYKFLAPDSVYKDLIVANPDDYMSFSPLEDAERREFFDSFVFDRKVIDSLSQYSFEIEKSKLQKGIRLKNSKKKGEILSRPLISGKYAVFYYKSQCPSYTENYVFAKQIQGQWVYIGDFLISASFVDPLIPKNWRWKMFWSSINIFRDKYCDY